MKKYYRTIVISDLHLGIKSAKALEVVRFLKHHRCDKLILNGDIIDGWQLKKSGSWKKKHSRFFKIILKMLAQEDMQVVYLRGNHDDFLDEILPLQIGNFSIARDHIHDSFGKRYYVVHGDLFDNITTHFRWIAQLGDVGYNFLLWLNRKYNNYRISRGLPYYSLSQQIKLKVKKAVNFISEFEVQLAEVARTKKCEGIITGHIHQAANRVIGDIHYLNSGDWVESMTALAETWSGEWKIIRYTDWLHELNAEKIHKALGTAGQESSSLLSQAS